MRDTFVSGIKEDIKEGIVFNKKNRNMDIINFKNIDKRLIEVWKDDSLAAEQFRILRTYILKAVKKNECKIFLISSAVHNEGKSLTAANLAISVARGLDESVLLIDGDLRKPKVSLMLGISKETRGLAQYLIDGGDYINYVTKSYIPKLNLIPPGPSPQNPSELINSNHMVDLIKQLKNQSNNQIVIIDAPPLIPVTDSIILSSLADAIIIVIKASETQREIVNEAIEKIGNKKKILGLVLNGCEFSKSRYHYYYHYVKDMKE
ncbi:MAG: CpsD/CapB family tyrosine-protein kinase [bacterium]